MDPLSVDSTLVGLALRATLRKRGQDSTNDEARALGEVGLKVVYQPKPDASIAVDVVFVHGLSGHPWNTWRGLNCLWPKDLLPQDVPNARVLTFGYGALLGEEGTTSVTGLGQLLLGSIVRDRLQGDPSRPIIFVAHSLGGLVVKSALVYADASGKLDPTAALVVTATKGICFFGTPHNETNRASWSASVAQVWKAFTSQPEQASRPAMKVLSTAKGGTGARINLMFAELVRYQKIQILSFYEKRLTHTVVGKTLIVDLQSATIGLDREALVPISADHNDLAKFNSRDSSAYKAVLAFMRDILKTADNPIEVELSNDARSAIESAKACESDATSISSEMRLDVPERERIFLSRLKRSWLDYLAIPGDLCGVPTWLEESSPWKQWLHGGQILWIIGDQGMGKTYLARLLIAVLRRDTAQTIESILEPQPEREPPAPPSPPSRLVLYYFCDARRPSRKEDVVVLRSLLYQALTQDTSLFRYIYGTPIFPTAQGNFWQFQQAFNMVLSNLSRGPTDIVIDAIDECDEHSYRNLLGFLRSFESLSSVRVILTSRPVPELRPSLSINLDTSREYHEKDLRIAVQRAVAELALFRRFSVEFAKEVFDNLQKKTPNILAAHLSLALLEQKPTIRATREALRRLPDVAKLDDLFSEVLETIRGSNRSILIRAYYITCCSRRILTVDELSVLLATISAGMDGRWPDLLDILESEILGLESILQTFRRGLLNVQDGTVALVHGALPGFLLNPKVLPLFVEALREDDRGNRFRRTIATEGLVQSVMAEACLQYMSAADKGRGDPKGAAEYCFAYWGVHAREAGPDCSDELVALVSDFLEPSQESQDLYQSMVRSVTRSTENSARLLPPCNEPAFVLAALDLCSTLADRLCLPISSFEATDSTGRLPLHYAVANDAVQSTKWILDKYSKLGADRFKALATKPSLEKVTTLQLATQRGRLHILNLLLDSIGDDGSLARSLMPLAADHDQQDVLASLGRRSNASSIPPVSPTEKGKILACAVRLDNREAAQELLEDQTLANADADRLQLHDAVERQSSQIVQMLIEHRVDVNTPNTVGSYPIHIAARLGVDEILQLLLRAGAKVNQTDSMGRTALHVASRYGFIRTCTHLLDSGSSVNLVDDSGRLPAHYAADIGHDRLLRLLLDQGSDTLMADNNQKTMLLLAAEKGHDEVVAMLLNPEKVDIDVDAVDSLGRTALHYAVMSGNSNIVSRLLIAGAYIDATDSSGLTPLHLAVSKAADIIVAELLKNNAGVNHQDVKGRTPLHHALMTSHLSVAVLRALLDRGTDINKIDNDGMTPLHYAAKNNPPCYFLLLDYGARKDIPNADGLLPGDLLEYDKPAAMEMREKL